MASIFVRSIIGGRKTAGTSGGGGNEPARHGGRTIGKQLPVQRLAYAEWRWR